MKKKQERFYTHSIVSYARLEELLPLFDASSHYCYIYHDKDKTDCHYHIVATFPIQKSINAVRNMVVSCSNTFSQELGDIDKMITYLTHEEESDEKARYNANDIVYDDVDYWKKRLRTCESQPDANDMFVDDLISSDFTIEFMARKYGRDFIKNHKNYILFRKLLCAERLFKRKGDDYNNIQFD